MGTVETAVVTFEEFLNLPDPPSGHLELHHGQVITVPPRKHLHAEIQQALLELLLPFTSDRGFVTNEFPFRAPGHEAWQADVGFVREDRRAGITDYLMGAPDLVVEVLSPSNTVDEISDKMDVCLTSGCLSFWVVDPKRQMVSVTEGDVTRQYRSSASIPLPPPLEGAIQVAAIFERLKSR
ncbi:MAG: Uma2 family endonuclease [Bryobacteraceae bacterium]|jgi:Uma2 family endonuclease